MQFSLFPFGRLQYIKMTRSSVLADALNAINNAEKTGKRQVMIRPSSKVIIKFLQVMQKHGMFKIANILWRLFATHWALFVCLFVSRFPDW